MERQTKEITTPINKDVVIIKEWITGREYDEIQKPMTNVKMVIDSEGVSKGEIEAGEATRQSVKIAIEKIVVSVNGESKNVYDLVGNLRKEDYQFVLKEIDNIVKNETFTKPPINQ